VIAERNPWALLDVFKVFLEKLLAFGARLSLQKCDFFASMLCWCGMEIDLPRSAWRIDPRRVAALAEEPIPRDRDSLILATSVLRYYYFGVKDQLKQRERIARLAELEAPRSDVAAAMAADGGALTQLLRDAREAVRSGHWLLIYDPSKPVWCWTDAASEHGFAVVAAQFDDVTGQLQPISYFSKGWLEPQLRGWTAQVKECYAQRYAMTNIMPLAFPYASVYLLCDNRNLASVADSADRRIVRWQAEILASGCIRRSWIPGQYNTIADFGSRSVEPVDSLPTEEEDFEGHIYALVFGEGGEGSAGPSSSPGATTVLGHLHMDTMVGKIVTAQQAVTEEELASWRRTRAYSKVIVAGLPLHLLERRMIVPAKADELKQALLRLAHDDEAHISGAERTVLQLKRQARVVWLNMDKDAEAYIGSCFRCQFTKAGHHEGKIGTSTPTIPPYVYHTAYADLKGPLPNDTGYILAVVEGISKCVRLRYLPAANTKEVTEELDEAFASWGTFPVVLRTDGGPPFNAAALASWASERGITPILGVPEHHQGQGSVETKFRGIASAIMAMLGGKAPTSWFKDPRTLMRLEEVINSTYTSAHGGSPSWVLTGREPRTRLSAATSSGLDDAVLSDLLGLPSVTSNDINEIISQHHDQIDKVQRRASLALSLGQALSKSRYDAARVAADFKVDAWVLVHRMAPNRLVPHFTGPYKVVRVSDDANFVHVLHYLTPTAEPEGPVHVSRLLHFDFSRATAEQIAQFQLGDDSGIVSNVKSHRLLPDGTYEYEVEFVGNPVPFWLPGFGLRRVVKVIDYAKQNALPPPGSLPKRAERAAASGRLLRDRSARG